MNNTIKLGNFISEYSVRNRAGDDIPVYSVTNKEGFCQDYFSKDVASQDRSTYKIVPRGCFAYNPSRINVGSVDWQRKEDRVIVSPLYVVFSVSQELDQQYLYYYLKSEKCLYYIKELASGSVRDNLKLSMLKEFTIPNITLEEQRNAVAIFEQADRLIALQERQMSRLDKLVKSRFVEMFGAIQEMVPLSYYIRGLSAGKSLAGEDECVNKVLKTGATTYDYFDSAQVKNLPLDYIPQEEHRVKTGDVIISRMNTAELVGAAAYVWEAPDHTYLPDRLWKAEVRDTACPIFVWQLLIQKDTKESIRRIASGTSGSMKNISKPGLLGIRVIKAEVATQNRFAAFVAEVDKSKLAVKQSLEKLETLKKSLMQQYFR